jgi:hypothetical protein
MSDRKRIRNIASGRIRASGSYSVMQRRRHRPPDALDYFPTPPWAARALCEFLESEIGSLSERDAWEPACGELHMAKGLADYFRSVRASDVFPYAPEIELLDFPLLGAFEPEIDFVVTNPPFKLAEEFISAALKIAKIGVAMLVRSAFIEGQDRHEELFSKTPPAFVLQFCERVTLLESRLIRANEVDPFAQVEGSKASSATPYCWLVWLKPREMKIAACAGLRRADSGSSGQAIIRLFDRSASSICRWIVRRKRRRMRLRGH